MIRNPGNRWANIRRFMAVSAIICGLFIGGALGCAPRVALSEPSVSEAGESDLGGTESSPDGSLPGGVEPALPMESADMASSAEPNGDSAKLEQARDSSVGASMTGPVVSAISIESVGPSENALVAAVSATASYSLKRTAPSEYVLKIDGGQVDPMAATAIVAPASQGQIRSVRPVSQGGDLLLRIFTTPQSRLSAERHGNSIVVKPQMAALPDIVLDEARAQMATEGDAASSGASNANGTVAADKATADATTPSLDTDIAALLEEQPKYVGRLISLDLQDTDIDNALRIIAEVSNLNIIASEDVAGKVTLRLIDVPWDQALDVILKTNGLDKVQEGNVVRIAPVEKLRLEREALKQAQQAEEELEALGVKYIRVSYAKAAELKPLVDSVVSERGSVTFDSRTNQLIIKDIRKGVRNVVELVSKLDLRTPQILIETQIVEAKRDFTRQLGAELGFQSLQSPETGNATGSNFPNTINVVGDSGTPGADPGNMSSFPAAAGAGISFLLGSADGSLTLNTRLSALETEGRGRVVSRPSVATTNSKKAVIKSVEKIRIKTPSGGSTVSVGTSGSSSDSGVATEVIEVGIILEVTPQASPDYFVLLDINAKSSTLGVERVDGIPGEIERSATSTVLVSSGQTFAMGGIYKIDDLSSIEGVPFLKDIPFVGHFFRRLIVDNGDEELLFFLTPRIVEGSFDDATMKMAS